jgi:hypothetical protein
MTFPEIWETPFKLKARLPLSGVKTTLNRVAEKLELDMQVVSELDSRILIAEAKGTSVQSAAMATEKEDINRMVKEMSVVSVKLDGDGWV